MKVAEETMANNAHFINATNGHPTIVVRDDRGASITELELQNAVAAEGQADDELQIAGWVRSADWTEADDGWVAPVVAS